MKRLALLRWPQCAHLLEKFKRVSNAATSVARHDPLHAPKNLVAAPDDHFRKFREISPLGTGIRL